jgi:hypothetical protein
MKFLLPFLLATYETHITPQDASIMFGDPVQSAEWSMVPDVIICQGAPVKPHRVKQAVGYWSALGHDIGEVIEADANDFGCLRQVALNGEILIDLASQSFRMGEHIAVTKTWVVKDTKEILRARIEITSGWGNSDRVMEHELGHALGFRDFNQTGHIMHSDWSKGGHKFKGLERKQENNYSKENILNGI